MAKKKAVSEQIFTYRLEFVKVYEPTKWEPGAWEVDKKTKDAHFTGREIRVHTGYQAVMVAYLNDEKLGISQALGGEFASQEAAENHVKSYYPEIEIGNLFKPSYQAFLAGEIVA